MKFRTYCKVTDRMVDQVNLKWNDFEENVKIAFKENFQQWISFRSFVSKGTVSLSLSDPVLKECNSRFTPVP